jgi:tight adherence protein C
MIAGMRQVQASRESFAGRIEGFVQRSTVVSLQQLELEEPFSERILRPLLRSVSSLASRLLPRADLGQIRSQLLMAGSPWGLSPLDFLGLRLIGSAVVGALGAFFGVSSGWPLLQLLGAGALCAILGSYVPTFFIKRRIGVRQHDIFRALPDALDMLTICVDAGLAFDLAMLKIGEKWDNTVAREFNRVVAEIRMGLSREDALRRMVERTGVVDIGNFVAVLIQADQLGVSIADVLHVQSEQMRERRHQRAEELANQAPVKMVFPLVFLILPALFIMILGPAVPRMAYALSAMSGG